MGSGNRISIVPEVLKILRSRTAPNEKPRRLLPRLSPLPDAVRLLPLNSPALCKSCESSAQQHHFRGDPNLQKMELLSLSGLHGCDELKSAML